MIRGTKSNGNGNMLMNRQASVLKVHRVVLYLTTLGLVAYGMMAILYPEVLASGFNRFTKLDWAQFQIDRDVIAAYITLLWRLIGGFNLAVGFTLTLIVWKWMQPGRPWAWTTLLLGTLMAYLSPMTLDLTVKSIEVFEVIEFLMFGIFAATMLYVRKIYFTPADI